MLSGVVEILFRGIRYGHSVCPSFLEGEGIVFSEGIRCGDWIQGRDPFVERDTSESVEEGLPQSVHHGSFGNVVWLSLRSCAFHLFGKKVFDFFTLVL